jgi:hypothetical protein
MSSMKKNILAVALVAGLGLAGAAAAYNYGTSLSDDVGAPTDSDAALADAENVSYEMLVATSYNWTMNEALVFDIETADNAAAITDGFTVRVALNQRCTPHNAPAIGIVSPPTNVGVCAPTSDGAAFAFGAPGNILVGATSDIGSPNYDARLVLDPAIAVDWKVTFDGFTSGNTVATFRIEPTSTTPVGPGTVDDVITFKWNNAQLTSLNEFAATAAAGGSAKVDAEFWMVNVSNDSRFVNSTRSRTILESRNVAWSPARLRTRRKSTSTSTLPTTGTKTRSRRPASAGTASWVRPPTPAPWLRSSCPRATTTTRRSSTWVT